MSSSTRCSPTSGAPAGDAMLEAVVVGGGQAGLGASYHLARHGIEHVVLERGRVAETWRTQRWDSFFLNTPNWMNRLPGEAGAIEPRDAFLGRDAHVARLQAYADDQRLPLRTGVTVTAISGPASDGRFVVSGDDGSGTLELRARNVVVASGVLNVPKIPAIASSLPGWIGQLPAGGYRGPAGLPTGAVLVVGSGQSGVQIVEDLLAAGRTVYLCTSSVGRWPRRYRGRDAFEWLRDAGFFEMTPERLTDPKLRFAANPTISGVGRLGHTVSLQSLEEHGVILLGRPTAVEGDRLILDDTVGANIAFGDRKSAEAAADFEAHISASGVEAPALEPDPADVPHPDPASVRSPRELDVGAAGVGSVIWTTGFGGDLRYLGVPVLDEHDTPVHARGVTKVPGIYFLGLPWLSTRRSAIIFGVDEDAAYVADRIAERLVRD